MSVSTPRNQRPRSLRSSVPSACDLWNIGDVSCVASLNSVPTQVSARLEHPRSFIVVSACESDYIGDVSGRVRGRWWRFREQAGSATSTGRGSAIPIISRAVLSALYLCQIGDVRFFQVFSWGLVQVFCGRFYAPALGSFICGQLYSIRCWATVHMLCEEPHSISVLCLLPVLAWPGSSIFCFVCEG